MASQSKEEEVLKLILENSPLKEWHFAEIVREAKVTKAVANKWLKKYVKEGLLIKIKEKGKFPFFSVGSNNSGLLFMEKDLCLRAISQKRPYLEVAISKKCKNCHHFWQHHPWRLV